MKVRWREIGVRIALGASPSRVVRLLSRETLLLVAAGALVGIALYAGSARWIRQALYGASSDSLALAAAALVIVIIALLAIGSAIWRAARMEPASALRQE